MPDLEDIVGRYVNVEADGTKLRLFYEEAGEGVPLICLHTAGADSRQFRHLLNDTEITRHFRVIAFDLPYHGRSNPPEKWWLQKYELTTELYLGIIRAFWKALELERPVVLGCSMGGAIVLKVAVEYQDELTGIVGLESAAFADGRDNDFLNHPAVNASELIPSYTFGLNAPSSPEESCRENWWYYSQSGPGVYKGDVYYYCVDMDTREEIKTIDTNQCKVSLLSGEYDYSATPEMTKEVADSIAGARFVLMKGIGHFPMIENYAVFRPHLLVELEYMKDA
jgi:pimeloyl-ACP methyl ester carboxylesterase